MEIFKYNTIISIPLFSVIALFLVSKTSNFSFLNSTISKSILVLEKSKYRIIFQLNFLLKALLDFGFYFYLIQRFKLSFTSPLGLSLILSAGLFGLLGYFTEIKNSTLHKILVYLDIVIGSIAQILLARLTNESSFILFTNILMVINVLIAFIFLLANKTNVFIQAICALLVYIWLLIFVFKFL